MMDATTTLNPLSRKGFSLSEGQSREMQRAELREAAKGFEEMMLKIMLKEMFPKEGEESGFFGNGTGSGVYQQLFIDELARVSASSDQFGLAGMVERDVAAKAGLTDESEKRTEPIPGKSLGRHLPLPLRRSGYKSPAANGNADPSLSGQALRRYNEARFSLEAPLKGRISSEFGKRVDPFTGAERRHKGLDIAAPAGSVVSAAASGTVKYSGWQEGYGNIVIIGHEGGYETRYAHNSDNMVRKGDAVTAGQPIAKVGSTGRSTGPHLHFEVRRQNTPVDPSDLFATN